jgi:hypothetical protein
MHLYVPGSTAYTVGASLVVQLERHPEHGRFGVALDVGAEQYVPRSPYCQGATPSGLVAVVAHVGWSPGVAWANATATGGVIIPFEPDRLYDVLQVGADAGAGVGLSTDGSSGLILTGSVLAPMSEARFEVMRWDGWHAPRAMVGVHWPGAGCSYSL